MSSLVAASASPSLDPITVDNAHFFLCDIQETFRGKIVAYEGVIAAAVFLGKVAQALQIPLVTTEQAPFKPTVKELAPLITPEANPQNIVVSKSRFSMVVPEVQAKLADSPARTHVVLFGIEAHVCVLQTALDLLRQGFHVHLVVDGVSSQGTVDRDAALERMRMEGARATGSGTLVFTSAESVVYEIVKDAKHPLFKSIVPAIKEYAAAKKQAPAANAPAKL